nr:MAG TPA: hypothetical protein [Caudoviricetes sp.]
MVCLTLFNLFVLFDLFDAAKISIYFFKSKYLAFV